MDYDAVYEVLTDRPAVFPEAARPASEGVRPAAWLGAYRSYWVDRAASTLLDSWNSPKWKR